MYKMEQIQEKKREFNERLVDFKSAMIEYQIADANGNITDTVRDNFLNARSLIREEINEMNFMKDELQNQEQKIMNRIQEIQRQNRDKQEQYIDTKEETENKLDNNLASFPLKEQTDLQKRIIYFYLILQLLGVFAAIFILYIQTQTKPNKKIKLQNVQTKARRQVGQLYNTTWNTSEGIGKRALNIADRGTSYGIRQGRRASNNLLRFMFGEKAKK